MIYDHSIPNFIVENCKLKIHYHLKGHTALIFACKHGHVAAVDALIQNGADVNHVSYDGTTPLMWSAYSGKLIDLQ